MIFHVYAIRDELTTFMSPMLDSSNDSAIRNFRLAIDSNVMMEKNPTDFCLYKLGDYDNETGKIIPLDVPEFIVRGERTESNE